jgi:hypothetical protein
MPWKTTNRSAGWKSPNQVGGVRERLPLAAGKRISYPPVIRRKGSELTLASGSRAPAQYSTQPEAPALHAAPSAVAVLCAETVMFCRSDRSMRCVRRLRARWSPSRLDCPVTRAPERQQPGSPGPRQPCGFWPPGLAFSAITYRPPSPVGVERTTAHAPGNPMLAAGTTGLPPAHLSLGRALPVRGPP